ncbi:monosaccharide ABC transporter membrane protein (CUT2 family) [Scopulibacillus darangshiensis]|uniref:Monosaccharide ABC transporter membrane protein (CUT2 family) n=1 Tax=Scopulibacillus darangshiensis TaxID=442528 RepID=A0A4R2P6Y4_9BACL|nr:galactofuranose ABC transporter, permease protein YjfF [Scopulibacillus darangshiensis]TCP29565.1 monosaccharide ABC transporter membrane protein (CUT2 family) [Scopulibacillus darangshiensis]
MKIKFQIGGNNITILATLLLFIVLFGSGSILYEGFFSLQVFLNLFIDNAYLIIVATGLAFVIITGGIDLSVGAMVALVSTIIAFLLKQGVNPYLVIIFVLIIGVLFGFAQGFLITRFHLHPWIVTLAGMFFARGSAQLISTDNIAVNNKLFLKFSEIIIPFPGGSFLSIGAVAAIIIVVAGVYVAKFTSFGRNVYALGGNERSSLLMGLPVRRTKVMVYMLSGFCSALAGIVFTVYTLSGFAMHLLGMEMDAIAACVIGGILLTGGYGHIIGPLLGTLSTGVIQTIITFQGTLSSWWTKIVIGLLLCLFIVLQKLIVTGKFKYRSTKVSRKEEIKAEKRSSI